MKNLIPVYTAFYDELLGLLPLFYRGSSAGGEEEGRRLVRSYNASQQR
jgi:hypothetical protein